MHAITHHSISVATNEAVRLWAFASTEYPKQHEPLITALVISVLETCSTFALNCRRSMEVLDPSVKFPLDNPRWQWQPATAESRINDLFEATHRIIHARRLLIGMEPLPKHLSVVQGESVFIPYVQAETDRKQLAFIDPFAMAHAYLFGALPALLAKLGTTAAHVV